MSYITQGLSRVFTICINTNALIENYWCILYILDTELLAKANRPADVHSKMSKFISLWVRCGSAGIWQL